MMKSMLIALMYFISPNLVASGFEDDLLRKNGWPKKTEIVNIVSSKDKTRQPSIIFFASNRNKRPLLVGLHTWSGGFSQGGGETAYARWCIQNDWHFIHPHFRGPNNTQQALGSDFAVQDILDAVKYMKNHHMVDDDRVYLVGVSGGGYASLLMAGRAPKVWAGVSAWCSISDVEKWWRFHAIKQGKYKPGRYAKNIESAIGGRPDQSDQRKLDCNRRSPLHYLHQAKSVNLDINHGIHDGRKGSVPFTHSLEAFNQVASSADQISAPQINLYYSTLKIPDGLSEAKPDSAYGIQKPLFRRISNNTRITLFDGGHEINHAAALNWLAQQKRGTPAKWKIDNPIEFAASMKENQANR